MQMTQESSDPDLNLQLLNDHGIYTVEEINELSRTVKPQYSVIHLNTRSLKQHFEQMCNLLDSISCKFDLSVAPRHGSPLKLIIHVFKSQVTLYLMKIAPFRQVVVLLCMSDQAILSQLEMTSK